MFAVICNGTCPISTSQTLLINYKKPERQTPNKIFDVSFELWRLAGCERFQRGKWQGAVGCPTVGWKSKESAQHSISTWFSAQPTSPQVIETIKLIWVDSVRSSKLDLHWWDSTLSTIVQVHLRDPVSLGVWVCQSWHWNHCRRNETTELPEIMSRIDVKCLAQMVHNKKSTSFLRLPGFF